MMYACHVLGRADEDTGTPIFATVLGFASGPRCSLALEFHAGHSFPGWTYGEQLMNSNEMLSNVW